MSDTGTYYGPIPSGKIALDLIRIACPTTTPKARPGQIRSSILQFDYEKGTYTWETPRLFTTCDQSHLRTRQHPIVAKAPVKAELVLVLRKTP